MGDGGMIKINLLKPNVMVYDDSDPGGIIDIEKLETTRKINPCLYEVLWDKTEFNRKLEARKMEDKENEKTTV